MENIGAERDAVRLALALDLDGGFVYADQTQRVFEGKSLHHAQPKHSYLEADVAREQEDGRRLNVRGFALGGVSLGQLRL